MTALQNPQQRPHAWCLAALLLFFLFRVLAQLLQYLKPVNALPDFDRWMSGAIPYSLLLFSQIIIFAALGLIVLRWTSRPVIPSRVRGRVLGTFGIAYFTLMLVRLVIGTTFADPPDWFAYPIPAFFHLVLASFFIVMARYHSKFASNDSPHCETDH